MASFLALVVVDHFHIVDDGLAVLVLPEPEDDAVAARDRDGIGALAVTLESMDLAADTHQRVEGRSAIQMLQQSCYLALDLAGELAALALGESLAAPTAS